MRVSLRVMGTQGICRSHSSSCSRLWTDRQPAGRMDGSAGWDSDGFTRLVILKGTAVEHIELADILDLYALPDHRDRTLGLPGEFGNELLSEILRRWHTDTNMARFFLWLITPAHNAVTTLKPCHRLAHAEWWTAQPRDDLSKLSHLDIRGLQMLHHKKKPDMIVSFLLHWSSAESHKPLECSNV